jgi:DNA-binding transcriptional ArsR family regulator
MVEDLTELDAVFHALAHGARRTMLRRLAAGQLTVGELAAPLSMSLAAASKHVRVLELAGLVRRTIDGRRHVCRLEPRPLSEASAWLLF